MPIDRRSVLVLVALAVGAILPRASAASTCDGKPVTIEGTAVADEIRGTDGDDIINGLGGGDIIFTSDGNDTICGGAGVDKLMLQGDRGAANLKKGVASTNLGRASLFDVEDVFGTNGDDELIGDAGPNLLVGQAGNDKITGVGGKDDLIGQGGNDKFFPGSGDDEVRTQDPDGGLDTLSYREADGAVGVAVTSEGTFVFEYRGEHTRTRRESADELFGQFRIVEGSPFNDLLTPVATDNTMRGLGGDDALVGGELNDTLIGGNGDDTLVGGKGDDQLSGGKNNPVTNITNHGDLVDYKTSGTIDGVNVDLVTQTAFGEDIGNDVFSGIESARATKEGPSFLYGNDGPNVLIGDHWYDELYGAGGNDILAGFRETDLLDGGDGADFMDGGDDSDSFSPGAGDDLIIGGNGCKSTCPAGDDLTYAAAPNGVTVDLSAGTASTGAWGADTFLEIEGAVGSNFGDFFVGDSGDNFFYGEGGSDSADGGAGFDFCEAEARSGCEDPPLRQRL